MKNKISQLLEAIVELTEYRISQDDMMILAPPGTIDELVKQGGGSCLVCNSMGMIPTFNDVLLIEDDIIPKVVVKSLVSLHRVEMS